MKYTHQIAIKHPHIFNAQQRKLDNKQTPWDVPKQCIPLLTKPLEEAHLPKGRNYPYLEPWQTWSS